MSKVPLQPDKSMRPWFVRMANSAMNIFVLYLESLAQQMQRLDLGILVSFVTYDPG